MDADTTFLVLKAKQGDSAAFSKLYEFYASDMQRFALYMLKNSHDAEDAVQEAAVSAWKNIKNLRDDALFKAWIFKILSNKCKSMLASGGKNPDALNFKEAEFLLSDTDDGFFGDVAGKCPICGSDVIRTKFGYGCRGYRENGCKFTVRNVICGRVISIANVRLLLQNGRTSKIRGFISKNGKPFDAYLKLEEGKAVFDFD